MIGVRRCCRYTCPLFFILLRRAEDGCIEKIFLHVGPRFHIVLSQVCHSGEGILSQVFSELLLLGGKHTQALFQIAAENTLESTAIEADDLRQHIGRKQGLTPGFGFQNDLQQYGTGDVLFRCGIDYLDQFPSDDELAELGQGDVFALLGIVQPAVGVLFDNAI